jgi:hypothetical protein
MKARLLCRPETHVDAHQTLKQRNAIHAAPCSLAPIPIRAPLGARNGLMLCSKDQPVRSFVGAGR